MSSFELIVDKLDCARSCEEFVDFVYAQGQERYRDLAWRNIDDPYQVMVSEVMLQQTQVARVKNYWPSFLKHFPCADALAAASTADVLNQWQGLGYNRRALALKRAAETCSAHYAGNLPSTYDELIALDGVGPATAGGIIAFAYNRPSIYIETNVRSVFLHELFPNEEKVTDKQLVPYVEAALNYALSKDEGITPRSWYYALLDYGAYLKTQVKNPSRRSASYSRQSSFEGSWRQKRSFVLKLVLAHPDGILENEIRQQLVDFEISKGFEITEKEMFDRLIEELLSEKFFIRQDTYLCPM